ncbi:MAG TPA: DUF1570 domain-containing protein [Armatimonadota bacterium]|jgi:hypothetical protein
MRVLCALGLLLCLLASPAYAGKTYTFNSQFYVITTDLTGPIAQRIAGNLDAIYRVYRDYFSGITIQQKLAVYLYASRQDYLTFVNQTAGATPNKWNPAVFFEKDGWLVTVACVEDEQSLTSLLTMMQHEGMHQFLQARFGKTVPIWANEGLATYFEHMMLGKNGVLTGLVPFSSYDPIQAAVTHGTYLPFERLMTLSNADWATLNNAGSAAAQLIYSEAWSIIYFCHHYDRGQYRTAFINYVLKINQGLAPAQAFQEAFGTDYAMLEGIWKQYVLRLRPDLSPVELLGLARSVPPSRSTKELVFLPPGWNARDKSFVVRVAVLPVSQLGLNPDLIAFNPHCTLRLTWHIDAQGNQLEQFIYE